MPVRRDHDRQAAVVGIHSLPYSKNMGMTERRSGALAILVFTGWMIQLYAHHNPVSNLPGIGAWLALIGGLAAATGGGQG